jgi:uncharacterized protein
MSLAFSRYNVWADVGDQCAVFNGLSGAVTAISRADRARVEAFVAEQDDGAGVEQLIHDLAVKRVIVGADHDERLELRRRFDQGRWDSTTLGYTIVTSLGCNFDCPYCFEDKRPSLLKPAVADAMVEILEQALPTIDKLSVTWMGGEPLLGARQLLELSSRFIAVCDAADVAYAATIVTNGWFLDGPTAAALAAARVRSAQVTIDGPPDVHDHVRPHASGAPTFERIVANVMDAADHLEIHVRVNVDRHNAHRSGELLVMLAEAGLAGRVKVGLGRITDATSNAQAPVARYGSSCLSGPDFGEFELVFNALAHELGFGPPSAPRPVATPCTAVRAREVVVGSDGELWKCWDDIGDPAQVIGSVFEHRVTNEHLDPWLRYHPADDLDCSSCIAMPVCMGGCAHHHFHGLEPDARCGAFRHNHVGRITQLLQHRLGAATDRESLLARVGERRDLVAAGSMSVPVAIGRRREPVP